MKTKKIDQDVLAVLSRCEYMDNRVYLPSGQLERKLYEGINKVLAAAGGKWTRGLKAHLFEAGTNAAERCEGIMLTGEYALPPKDAFEFFETPPAVLDILMDCAQVEQFMTALDPEAGDGAITQRLVDAGAKVTAMEIDERHRASFRASGHSLGQLEIGWGDFLAWRPGHPAHLFDRVVMNPPFSRQQDIKHITHALRFVKPGGRLVSVASAGVIFREDARAVAFRTLVEHHRGEIERLPEGAFKVSGTGVNTCVVTMEGA